MQDRVVVQTEDFDLSAEIAKLRASDKRVGAVCSFVGTVRDVNDGDAVSELELDLASGFDGNSSSPTIWRASSGTSPSSAWKVCDSF